MITLDTLKKRNHDFAMRQFTASMSLFPAAKPIIISCVDPRADPAHILGLEFGDALVIRNIGGRITPATLQTIAMLQTVAQVQGVTYTLSFLLLLPHSSALLKDFIRCLVLTTSLFFPLVS
jgi:carbonic anhydrase